MGSRRSILSLSLVVLLSATIIYPVESSKRGIEDHLNWEQQRGLSEVTQDEASEEDAVQTVKVQSEFMELEAAPLANDGEVEQVAEADHKVTTAEAKAALAELEDTTIEVEGGWTGDTVVAKVDNETEDENVEVEHEATSTQSEVVEVTADVNDENEESKEAAVANRMVKYNSVVEGAEVEHETEQVAKGIRGAKAPEVETISTIAQAKVAAEQASIAAEVTVEAEDGAEEARKEAEAAASKAEEAEHAAEEAQKGAEIAEEETKRAKQAAENAEDAAGSSAAKAEKSAQGVEGSVEAAEGSKEAAEAAQERTEDAKEKSEAAASIATAAQEGAEKGAQEAKAAKAEVDLIIKEFKSELESLQSDLNLFQKELETLKEEAKQQMQVSYDKAEAERSSKIADERNSYLRKSASELVADIKSPCGDDDFIYFKMDQDEVFPVTEYATIINEDEFCPDFLCNQNYPRDRMVLFYYPDKQSGDFRSSYVNFASTLMSLIIQSDLGNGAFEFYALSCCANKDYCDNNEIDEYPSFKLIREGETAETGYNAVLSPHALVGLNAINSLEGVLDLILDSN